MLKVFLIFLFAPVTALAQTVLLQAPGSSPSSYREYLKAHPEMISFVASIQERLQKNPFQEKKLFQLADSFTENVDPTVAQLKEIQSEGPLTLLSLRYMRDLSEKSLALKITAAQRQELMHFYCKSSALLGEGPEIYKCPAQIVMLKHIAKLYPQVEKVFVESRLFDVEETSPLSPKTAYQWTLVSNTHKPINFFGTFEQLINQRFTFENQIEGSCEAFSTAQLEMDLINRSAVYFSDTCVGRANTLPEKKSWFAENKTWVYTAGAILLGGLAYSMKDKKLVIDTSAFH